MQLVSSRPSSSSSTIGRHRSPFDAVHPAYLTSADRPDDDDDDDDDDDADAEDDDDNDEDDDDDDEDVSFIAVVQ